MGVQWFLRQGGWCCEGGFWPLWQWLSGGWSWSPWWFAGPVWVGSGLSVHLALLPCVCHERLASSQVEELHLPEDFFGPWLWGFIPGLCPLWWVHDCAWPVVWFASLATAGMGVALLLTPRPALNYSLWQAYSQSFVPLHKANLCGRTGIRICQTAWHAICSAHLWHKVMRTSPTNKTCLQLSPTVYYRHPTHCALKQKYFSCF